MNVIEFNSILTLQTEFQLRNKAVKHLWQSAERVQIPASLTSFQSHAFTLHILTQYPYLPYSSLYIVFGTDTENLFNNQSSFGCLDQYQYLGNCPPTPPLTQQQSIDNNSRLMLV